MRLSVHLAFLAASLPAAASVQSAALNVTVTDGAGRPLPDAVVTLQPASGRLPVKPMAQVDIAQTRRQFTPRLTVVTVGTPVNFPNFDTVRHQVYSFSPIKTFEIKLYAGVPHAPIVFDKPGAAVLGCSIHDQMAAWVVVVDTPHFARTGASGEGTLEGLAPGSYLLRGWHAGVPEDKMPAPTAVTIGAADSTAVLRLPTTAP